MPELPEVEVIRRGLDRWIVGRTISSAEVLHPRAVRRNIGHLPDQLKGQTVMAAERRGKYLWLPLREGSGRTAPAPAAALLAHLGMSGQLLLADPFGPIDRHLRVRIGFADGGPELRFVDQRTFGHLLVADLAVHLPRPVPEPIRHIAPDPLEEAFDEEAFAANLRRRRTGIKRALLDQSLISGIGNIYADEALWRVGLHWATPTETLTRPAIRALLVAVRDVLTEALRQGGTSFDRLYVDVNGQSGYFARSLAVYGRRDQPCQRCGTPIQRESFMNRSSYRCPKCQPVPENARP